MLRLSARMHLQLAQDGPNIEYTRDMISASPSTDPQADRAFIAEHFRLAERSSALLLQLKPSENAVQVRADVLSAQEKWSELLALLEGHPELAANNPQLLWRQGDALLKTGAPQRARELAQSGLQLEPDNLDLLDLLAAAADALGDPTGAAEARARRGFYRFLVPSTKLAYGPETAKIVELLDRHLDRQAIDEKTVDQALDQLAQRKDEAAAEILGSFVWHHSHDDREVRLLTNLEQMGPIAHPILLRMVSHAQSVCTIKSCLQILAQHRAPEALPLLLEFLPRDQRFGFPMYIPRSLALLGDPVAIPELALFMLRPAPRDIDSMTVVGLTFAREQAALALGVLGGPQAEAALHQAARIPELAKAAQGGLCILRLRQAPEASILPAECTKFESQLSQDDLSLIGVGGQAIEALEIRPTAATQACGKRLGALSPPTKAE